MIKQESIFENYLNEIVYRNKSEIIKNIDDVYYPDLEQEQLEELCCLYAIEDKINNNEGDTKEEILGPNYNDDAGEFVEWIAKLICDHYIIDIEDIEENIEKISRKAIVRFYGNKIEKLYRLAMDEQIEISQDNDEEY